jgi:NAD(P)-dependent dehydrogenase (short-subunit alcohol dehydrogenase family)
VTVNAVSPGYIATDMLASMSDQHRHQIFAKIPMGRLGEPGEVAWVSYETHGQDCAVEKALPQEARLLSDWFPKA